jgi:hypothetical protein
MLLVGLGAGVLVAGWLWTRAGSDRVVIDLIEEFPKAKEVRPTPGSHAVVDATVAGDTRKAILVKEPGRVKFEFAVPDHAWLKISLGMLEEAQRIEGDGVVVYINVTPLGADGQPSFDAEGRLVTDELLSLAVDPYGTPADRSWHDLTLDLSRYAGKRVELVLITRSSPPANPPRNDARGDSLLWGQPRIVVD